MASSLPWRQRVGNQRDWVWRGWQTRYTYLRSTNPEGDTPLILLHGFGASIGHWRNNMPELAQQHTVYALDLLGFGASEKAVAAYDATFWAAQVYDFWKTFVNKPAVLVGNSNGSLVCLAVAALYPEMVKGIVLLNLPDSSVLDYAQWMQQAMKPLAFLARPLLKLAIGIFTFPLVFGPLFRLIRSPGFIKLWAKQAYTHPHTITEELLEILSVPAFDRGSVKALRAMVLSKRASKLDYAARTLLPKLEIPILLLWGKKDKMVPPKLAPLFVKYNPRLTLIEIDNAGHCLHDESPEEVNQLMLDWLAAKLEGGRERIKAQE
ncbi:alpha/beta fold hydrolase [Kovacikia minuta CCNUW1]|uniref:alpha/beta fold hydrolase n=1 Tax=Kovacikia minuta TaxID=2931930 RepID=UPI001CCA5382|nr:alpha/beta fold hydrolase [Kovacikia minuta]UBF27549.1 alpha/beta fold hydrolase [Kovacikia minuta CCNUW1]